MDVGRTVNVVAGPWISSSDWRTPRPDERAGRFVPQAQGVVVSAGNTDYGSRGATLHFDRPPLQLNLPIPGMPTLGKIARNRALRPKAPRAAISPRLPRHVQRYLAADYDIDPWGIDPIDLLQDPDWYDETTTN